MDTAYNSVLIREENAIEQVTNFIWFYYQNNDTWTVHVLYK